MTAVEFLQEKIKIYLPSIHQKGLEDAFKQAKEMFEQQIIDAYDQGDEDGYWHPENGYDKKFQSSDQYYNETYGSKGSDGHELDDDIPPTTHYFPTSSQTEISNEQIKKLAEVEYPIFDGDLLGIAHNQEHRRFGFIAGYNKAKEWYREQLKQKI